MVTNKKKIIIFLVYVAIFFIATSFRFFQISFFSSPNFPKSFFTGVAAQYYGGCTQNGVCESGETQENCPADCQTIVSMNPNVDLTQGQQVTVIIAFNDSRYVTGRQVSYRLVLDDSIVWNSTNGCPLGDNTKVTPDISLQGYVKITRTCIVPKINIGSHKLEATPTIY
jgi:hypothetical protein